MCSLSLRLARDITMSQLGTMFLSNVAHTENNHLRCWQKLNKFRKIPEKSGCTGHHAGYTLIALAWQSEQYWLRYGHFTFLNEWSVGNSFLKCSNSASRLILNSEVKQSFKIIIPTVTTFVVKLIINPKDDPRFFWRAPNTIERFLINKDS